MWGFFHFICCCIFVQIDLGTFTSSRDHFIFELLQSNLSRVDRVKFALRWSEISTRVGVKTDLGFSSLCFSSDLSWTRTNCRVTLTFLRRSVSLHTRPSVFGPAVLENVWKYRRVKSVEEPSASSLCKIMCARCQAWVFLDKWVKWESRK